ARRGLGLRADRQGRLPQHGIRPAVHPAGGKRRGAADPRRGARRDPDLVRDHGRPVGRRERPERAHGRLRPGDRHQLELRPGPRQGGLWRGPPTTTPPAGARGRGRGGPRLSGEYTVATLAEDIASTTQSKESYVREAQGKESKLFGLLDGLTTLWKDPDLVQ